MTYNLLILFPGYAKTNPENKPNTCRPLHPSNISTALEPA